MKEIQIEITRKNIENFSHNLHKKRIPKKILFLYEKESGLSMLEASEMIKNMLDKLILKNIDIAIANIPYCFLVGYKRYVLELQSDEKIKPKKCEECKHYAECSGIWKKYIEKFGDKEILPITGKYLITDNERCMIEILLKVGSATTAQLLELKNSSEFKDICAHCVGSDDIMLTGSKLIAKGVLNRQFTPSGYLWSINREHQLVRMVQGHDR